MNTAQCETCSHSVHPGATTCPGCGATGKSKMAAGLLALFLGPLGIHRLYLGQIWGLAYLLVTVVLLISLFIGAPVVFLGIFGAICLGEAFAFLCTNDVAWNQKYGFARQDEDVSPPPSGSTGTATDKEINLWARVNWVWTGVGIAALLLFVFAVIGDIDRQQREERAADLAARREVWEQAARAEEQAAEQAARAEEQAVQMRAGQALAARELGGREWYAYCHEWRSISQIGAVNWTGDFWVLSALLETAYKEDYPGVDCWVHDTLEGAAESVASFVRRRSPSRPSNWQPSNSIVARGFGIKELEKRANEAREAERQRAIDAEVERARRGIGRPD